MLIRTLALLAIFLPVAPFAKAQTNEKALEHLKLGSEHLKRNAVEEAIRECKTAVSLDPQSAAAHMLLAQAYLAQKSISMVAEAKAELQQALDLNPHLLWARFYLAKVYIDLGRPEKAKEELEQGLQQRPGVPHFLSLLGEVERKLGRPEAGIELQRKAVEADPSMTPAHYYAALAYLDLKKEDDAVRELEAATRPPYVSTEMYLTLGSIYTRRRQFAQAEDVCKKALALDPSRSETYLNMAQLYNVQGLGDKALAALKLAVPDGKNFPATAYYQQFQADVFFEAGQSYQIKKMPREAVRAFERSLELDGNRGKTHRHLAQALADAGNFAEARRHVEAAEKMGAAVDAELRDRIEAGNTRPR